MNVQAVSKLQVASASAAHFAVVDRIIQETGFKN
jgi:hypothetical protein